MPDQTKSIISGGGGDYSTIQTWENDTDVSGGFWKGEIQDSAAYDEAITIAGGTGTPTSSNYVWLTASLGNRHAGVAGTGHARVHTDTASGHAFTISSDFVRIEYLEVKLVTPGSSDECFHVNDNVNDLLLEKLYIWTDSATSDTDGIYAADDADLTVVNCILEGFDRAGFHAQNFSGTVTQTWNLAFNSLYDNRRNIYVRAQGASTITLDCFNNAALAPTVTDYDVFDATSETSSDWTGSHNADSDNSIASRDANVEDTIDTNTQANLVATTVWTDPANGDFTVVSGQGLAGNGTASFTAGDTRADTSVDIAGTTRSNPPSIGAFDLGAAVGEDEEFAGTLVSNERQLFRDEVVNY